VTIAVTNPFRTRPSIHLHGNSLSCVDDCVARAEFLPGRTGQNICFTGFRCCNGTDCITVTRLSGALVFVGRSTPPSLSRDKDPITYDRDYFCLLWRLARRTPTPVTATSKNKAIITTSTGVTAGQRFEDVTSKGPPPLS